MTKVFDPIANHAQAHDPVQQEPAPAAPQVSVSASGALDVSSHKICPKCGQATSLSKLADGRAVTFCSGCAVTLPIPLE